MTQNHKEKISNEKIVEMYNQNITLHEAAVQLQMTTVSLWRRAKQLNLKWSDKKQEKIGLIPIREIIEGKHPSYQTFKLKNRLINEGLKENKCESCGITEWNGKQLIMQLDHIDGNPHNHLFVNLRLLCPNCHAQTHTYCGKNK